MQRKLIKENTYFIIEKILLSLRSNFKLNIQLICNSDDNKSVIILPGLTQFQILSALAKCSQGSIQDMVYQDYVSRGKMTLVLFDLLNEKVSAEMNTGKEILLLQE